MKYLQCEQELIQLNKQRVKLSEEIGAVYDQEMEAVNELVVEVPGESKIKHFRHEGKVYMLRKVASRWEVNV